MITMAGHYGSQGYLVALKARVQFLKSGWYALQMYTQIGQAAPRSLKAESAWQHIDVKSDAVSLDGSDMTFEFTDPVVVSSLRNPGTASDQDAVGFEVLFIPDEGEYTDYTHQTMHDPVKGEDESSDEFTARVEEFAANLLPQIAYYNPSDYTVPGASWNNDCWLYDPDIFGSNTSVELPGSLVRVWDIDNKGWRIVNAATVTDVTFISYFFDDLDNEDIENEDIAL